MTTNTFAATAERYRARGWMNTIMIKEGLKAPVHKGVTGHHGRAVTDADIERWAAAHPGHTRMGLRLPDGVVGVDVDDYGPKHGGETLEALQRQYGPLPATVCSTARTGVSGIRLFRVPPGTYVKRDAGPGSDIDFIQHTYRLMVVSPSVHHRTGTEYRWLDADGAPVSIDALPSPDELPWLPDAWLAEIRRTYASADDVVVDDWLADLAEGERHEYVSATLTDGVARLAGDEPRRDVMVSAMMGLIRHGSMGREDVRAALDELRDAFMDATEGDAERERQWHNALRDGIAKVQRDAAASTDDADTAGLPVTASKASKAADDNRVTAETVLTWFMDNYSLGTSTDGLTFAVPRIGAPRIARELTAIGSSVSRRFRESRQDQYGKGGVVIGKDTVAAALYTASDYAADGHAVKLALRAAQEADRRIVVDLGRADARVVEVTPNGWAVVESTDALPLFRRTPATAELPVPVHGGSADTLRQLLALDEGPRWKLIRGWLAAVLFADIPRPILWATGAYGSGKSTRMRMVMGVVDPAPELGAPAGKNERDDTTRALGRYLPSYDNVTAVSQSASDWLCRLVTGSSSGARALYTDDQLRSVSYRRAAVATSINLPTGLGADALERLVLVDFERLGTMGDFDEAGADAATDDVRQTEQQLRERYAAALPAILGAVLDDVAMILRNVEAIDNERRRVPRMADYARVLAALDMGLGLADGSGHFSAYVDSVHANLEERAQDDPFTAAILELIERRTTWSGTADQLLLTLNSTASDKPEWWPQSGRKVSAQLKRASEELRRAGVAYTPPVKVGGERKLTLSKINSRPAVSAAA